MKKRKNQAGSTKGVAAAAEEKTTFIKNRGKIVKGIYYYQTPLSVREKSKLLYVVVFHQYPTSGQGAQFPKPQVVEFANSNPLVARRNAFEFAQSDYVFPDGKSLYKVTQTDSKEFKVDGIKQKSTIFRYCTILCVPFGQIQGELVYIEKNSNPTPAFLEGLEKELEFFKNFGLGDIVKTTEVIDEEGTSHTIIAEGNKFAEIKKVS